MPNSSTQQLQIFLSSNFIDLRIEHSAAIEAILSCGHYPTGMGQFRTAHEAFFSRSTIERWIDTADIYILLLGKSYGDLDPETGKSYIHLEYEYAVAQNIPIIACLINVDQLGQPSPDSNTSENFDLLMQLRHQTLKQRPYYWKEAQDLKQVLLTRLTELTQIAQSTSLAENAPQTEAVDIIMLTLQTYTQSIQDVTGASQEVHRIADNALSMAHAGKTAAQTTVADLTQVQATVAESARIAKRLGENTQKMSQVMKLVNQLASRANVIALNASIEVSRMGVRGEEFTTIANDLRDLAKQTGKLAKMVDNVVLPIQDKTNRVVTSLAAGMQDAIATTQPASQTKETLGQLSQTLEQLNQHIQRIVQSTVEQTAASTCMSEILQSLNVEIDSPQDSTS